MWSKLFTQLAVLQPLRDPLSFNRQDADIMGNAHFLMTLLAALTLHIMGFFIWSMVPKTQVVEIPVHVLNVKLGDAEVMEDTPVPQPAVNNKNDVENTISRLVREQAPETQAREKSVVNSINKAMTPKDIVPVLPSTKPGKTGKPGKPVDRGTFDVRQEGVNTAAPVTPVTEKQFVRNTGVQAVIRPDGAKGNSAAKDAEMIARYEQLISLWIQKFKIYPQEAKDQHLQGDTLVRLRIDRQGTIRYYLLEYSTGHQILDRAAIDMIRRANPVPSVPIDYPQGDLIEFLVPVTFHLQ